MHACVYVYACVVCVCMRASVSHMPASMQTRISSVLLLFSCPGHCVVSLSLCPCAGAIASLSLCPCLCVLVCVTVFLSLGVVSVFVSLSLCPCCLVLVLVSGADLFLWFGAGDSKRLGIQGATHPAAVATPRSCGVVVGMMSYIEVCSTKAFNVDDGMHWVPSIASSVQRPMANSVGSSFGCGGGFRVILPPSPSQMGCVAQHVARSPCIAHPWHNAMPNQLGLRLPCKSPLASSCVLRPTTRALLRRRASCVPR